MVTEHLQCSTCEENVTVARFDGDVALICHCTHVGSDTDPAAVEGVRNEPETWMWA